MNLPGSGPSASINVTPLVDVCLVLLVTFMVVTPMLNRDGVELPKAPKPDEETRGKDDLVVAVLADPPGYRLGEDRLSLEVLRDRLVEIHKSEPSRKVRVRADRRLTWRAVRDVLKDIAGSGFDNAALITEKPDGAPRQEGW